MTPAIYIMSTYVEVRSASAGGDAEHADFLARCEARNAERRAARRAARGGAS